MPPPRRGRDSADTVRRPRYSSRDRNRPAGRRGYALVQHAWFRSRDAAQAQVLREDRKANRPFRRALAARESPLRRLRQNALDARRDRLQAEIETKTSRLIGGERPK